MPPRSGIVPVLSGGDKKEGLPLTPRLRFLRQAELVLPATTVLAKTTPAAAGRKAACVRAAN
jgi:hypothetical protein